MKHRGIDMIKIMFICQGNICRSPMAMFYLRYRLTQLGLQDKCEVTSAALESSTKGQDMEQKAKEELDKAQIPYTLHSAHKLNIREFMEQDYVLYMEAYQKIEISRMMSSKALTKAHRLYGFTGVSKDIDDPYYTGDFHTAFLEIKEAVDAFIEKEIMYRK